MYMESILDDLKNFRAKITFLRPIKTKIYGLVFSMIILFGDFSLGVEAAGRRQDQQDFEQLRPVPLNRYMSNANAKTRSINCYSCMSMIYQPLLKVSRELSATFYEPETYDDECSADRGVNGLRTVECSTVCVSMKEEVELLGTTYVGHIRGCFDHMLVNGFNDSIVKWYRWLHRDSCNFYNKRDILQLPKQYQQQQQHHHHSLSSANFPSTAGQNLANQSPNGKNVRVPPSMFQICVCYLDSCNAGWRLETSNILRSMNGRRNNFFFTFLLNLLLFYTINLLVNARYD
uniref:Uncharacterized protein n=1 Tax=Romanomermis culicivorax TaxID=13658 RepID=A0A915KYJ2_ROMCU